MFIIPTSNRICIRKLSPAEKGWFEQNPTRRYRILETMLEAVKRSLGKRGSDSLTLIRALNEDHCAQISLPLSPNANTGELDEVIDALFDVGVIERLIGQNDLLLLADGGSIQ